MKHDIQWFLDHIESKKTVKRIAHDKDTDTTRTSYMRIDTPEKAEYLYGLQSDYIRFEENNPRSHGYKKDKTDDPFESDKPVVRIHKIDMDLGCSSCEA